MAVMIISLAILLIMNTMAVFAYRDEVLSLETQKDSLLSINIKYSSLMDNMSDNVEQYLKTRDVVYKSQFYSLRNNYLEIDTDHTLSSQIGDIQFNDNEQELYQDFLKTYHQAVGILSAAVESRDPDFIMVSNFDGVYYQQSQIMSELTNSYVDRLNQKEDAAIQRQSIFEGTLIIVSLLLLCFSTATFWLIIRENAYNSYFSKLYNTVVENMDGGIAILDKDYRLDYMNPKYREILDISSENIKGKTLRDTVDQKLASALENATLDNPSGEGKLDLLVGNNKKNIVYSYFTIDDEHGNNKYVNLIRDTSKTEELQHQLRIQLKEINFYSQAKDSFIANISHEIKTPINAILGMVHFLKSTRLSQNQKDLVRKIETSSDILLTIISDVLDLSKIKNNSLSLYPSDFSLEMVIKNVEDMFSNQMAFKGIEWRTDYNFSSNLCLHLDKTRFVQVLVNLITNAYKFTDSGYVKLSVETLSENDDTVLLQFCVEDTGIGIAEKDISKLFREFEQLENHLTKQHQGTGLGLYICKNIIESMDGRMWVKSTKGKGSKFYFSLPAKKALEPKLSATSNVINTIPLDGSGGKALVVEDTEINAEVAVKLLNDVNVACDTAPDGQSAIEMCAGKSSDYYNVILMDIHMPNMDGYTAASIIKNELKVTSPIVALTASDINDQIRLEHADTIESFILKPFKAAAFYKAIAAYFPNGEETVILNTSRKKHFEPKEPSAVKEPKPAANGSLPEKNDTRRDPFAGREDAIKNLGGLESIYYKHVEKFKVNYANTADHIAALMEEKNYEEARRLAHSIKGLGGTLGMLDVMEASMLLEKAIMNGDGYDWTPALDNFRSELDAAIEAI